MSSETWAAILAPLIGVVLTIVYRLVDRFIPDESGAHPLPATAAAAYGNERAIMSSTPHASVPDEDTHPTVNDPATDPDAQPVQDSGPVVTDDGDPTPVDDAEPEDGPDHEA